MGRFYYNITMEEFIDLKELQAALFPVYGRGGEVDIYTFTIITIKIQQMIQMNNVG